MLRLRTTTTLSLLALAIGVAGTGWLSTQTGAWPGPPARYTAQVDTPFLQTMTDAGYAPESIDMVLCTHLHVDHVGWNTRLK
ncbi:MAG: MBL fold metallo-hydrolase, partial [Rhodanobacter sp.]